MAGLRFDRTQLLRPVADLLSDDDSCGLQAALLLRPAAGALFPGSGGIRKLRWRREERGKRGRVRLRYYWLLGTTHLHASHLGKAPGGLTPQQLKTLQRVVKENLEWTRSSSTSDLISARRANRRGKLNWASLRIQPEATAIERGYDFSKAESRDDRRQCWDAAQLGAGSPQRNPYANRLKKQITIRVDVEALGAKSRTRLFPRAITAAWHPVPDGDESVPRARLCLVEAPTAHELECGTRAAAWEAVRVRYEARKLDSLADRALRDHAAGRSTKL